MSADQLAEDIGQFRRAIIPEFLVGMLRRMGGDEPNLPLVATLYVLDVGDTPTVGELAERLGRSTSVTSRLVDHMVKRGWVDRAEDIEDRRAKRVQITPKGRSFLRGFEGVRAEAQREVMAHLTADEQRHVSEAMALLAEASRRRLDEQRDTSGD
jgi:DNA-binding MarR family transcriptional regulator